MGDRGPSPVTVLSGFLGAGKTTLLRAILASGHVAPEEVGLVINDLAEVNVDARLVAEPSNQDATVAAASEDVHGACACCSGRTEFIADVLRLACRRPPLSHILVECSGMSDPANIVRTLLTMPSSVGESSSLKQQPVFLSAVVTVLDSATLAAWIASSPTVAGVPEGGLPALSGHSHTISQLFVSQIECASTVVLHKVDRVTVGQLSSCVHFVRTLNPAATVHCAKFGVVDPAAILCPPEPYSVKMASWLAQAGPGPAEATLAQPTPPGPESVTGVGAATRELAGNGNHGTDPGCNGGGPEVTAASSEERKPSHKVGEEGHSPHEHGHTHAEGDGGECRQCCGTGEKGVDCRPGDRSGGGGADQGGGGSSEVPGEVRSFVFRASRPFHPDRLQALIRRIRREMAVIDGHAVGVKWRGDRGGSSGGAEGCLGGVRPFMEGVLRSKGLVWVAPHMDLSREWSHTRGVFELQKGQPWLSGEGEEDLGERAPGGGTCSGSGTAGAGAGYGDRRQEVVFIGTDLMDETGIRRELDCCLLNDVELGLGPRGWRATIKDKIALTLTVQARTEASRQPLTHGSMCPCCDPRLKQLLSNTLDSL